MLSFKPEKVAMLYDTSTTATRTQDKNGAVTVSMYAYP